MNKYNFQIYIDTGSGYSLITDQRAVKQVASASISREDEEMYYRIKLGEITFKNIPEYKIYDIIEAVDFTTEMKIKIVYGSLEIEGYFAKIDCDFDDDKNGKIIKVTPAINDNYRLFLENYETEISISENDWDYETTVARVTSDKMITSEFWYKNSPSINNYGVKVLKDKQWDKINTEGETDFRDFFFVGSSNEGEPNIVGTFDTPPYDARDSYGIDLSALIAQQESYNLGWELSEVTVWRGSSWWVPFKTKRVFYVTCSFSRESLFVPTSDGTETGDKVYPEGEGIGWESGDDPIFSRRLGGIWGYQFARKPFNGAYSDNWELQSVIENNGDGGGASFFWTHARTTKINYPSSDEDDGKITINTLIDFKSLLTHMYQNLHEDLATKEVKSLFLFNDDEETFSFMEGLTGCNYVTAEPNELNYLKCFHTYTLKTDVSESEDSEDSILNLTIKSVIEDLQRIFPLKMYIDDDLNLWLEHPKFFELTKSSLDISSKKELELTKRFTFDQSLLFDKKTFSQVNSGYVDFNNNLMEFVQAVSNKRDKDTTYEIMTEIFTTDLQYCLDNPNDLENSLVLVLSKDGEIINDTGFVSETEQLNGALSLSQILNKYHRYEGVWTTGKINGNDATFTNSLRSKVSSESIKFNGIAPNLFYKTKLGIGLIDEGTLDFENSNTEIKTRHRYTSSEIGDSGFYLAWGDDEGEIFDFGNTEN